MEVFWAVTPVALSQSDFLVLVRLDVLAEVVTSHEPFTTLRAHEPLLARVCPQVPL